MLYRALMAAGADVEYLETAGDHVFVTSGKPTLPYVTDRSLDFLKRRPVFAAATKPTGERPAIRESA
jgi:hypothetical protein